MIFKKIFEIQREKFRSWIIPAFRGKFRTETEVGKFKIWIFRVKNPEHKLKQEEFRIWIIPEWKIKCIKSRNNFPKS